MGAKLGQVFLHDSNIIRKIIQAADLHPTDNVVEIGCGDGILTDALSTACAQVTVFEIDPICIAKTQARLRDRSNIRYIEGDFLKTASELETFSAPVKVVANVPYYISTPIIKALITHIHQVTDAIIMVQKEYAGKLIAQPEAALYTSFSVYASAFWTISSLFGVSRNCFYPVPNVDSAVVHLKPAPTPIPGDPDVFFTVVQSGFWGRRKPLRSALAKSPYITLKPEFKNCDFFIEHPTIRAESLSLADFFTLFEMIQPFIVATNSSRTAPI